MYAFNFIEYMVDMLKIPFTLYGITFSMWQVYLFFLFIPLILWIINEVF